MLYEWPLNIMYLAKPLVLTLNKRGRTHARIQAYKTVHEELQNMVPHFILGQLKHSPANNNMIQRGHPTHTFQNGFKYEFWAKYSFCIIVPMGIISIVAGWFFFVHFVQFIVLVCRNFMFYYMYVFCITKIASFFHTEKRKKMNKNCLLLFVPYYICMLVIISGKWDVFAAIRRCCFEKTCFEIIAAAVAIMKRNGIVYENEFRPFNGLPNEMHHLRVRITLAVVSSVKMVRQLFIVMKW